jgi:RimJ/RimL family protein N-acetyltransferase
MDLTLRPTLPDDLPFVLALERDEANRPFIAPWPEERHRAAMADPDCFHAILQGEERHGFLILMGRTSPHRAIEFRRIVVDGKGRGVGRSAVRLLKRLAFKDWKAHRLWLDVKSFNDRAKSLYLSEGFKEEGVLRDCLWSGDRYESLVMMSMLESEYSE